MIRLYSRDLINNHKPTTSNSDSEREEWKVQLIM